MIILHSFALAEKQQNLITHLELQVNPVWFLINPLYSRSFLYIQGNFASFNLAPKKKGYSVLYSPQGKSEVKRSAPTKDQTQDLACVSQM